MASRIKVGDHMQSRSEQGAAEDGHGSGEVDNEPGDVHECGDEGGGGGGGVEAEPLEEEGEHRAGERAPDDDPDQRCGDGEPDEEPMLAVDVEDRVPGGDAHESDDAQDGAEEEAGDELAAEDGPPVAQPDLAQGHGPD